MNKPLPEGRDRLATPAIVLSDLLFSYSGKPQEAVLHIPQWQLHKGEHVFLYGASGAGKSTLLHLLAGMLTASSGEVEVLGQSLGKLSGRQRDAFRARYIGMVFQQLNLLPYLGVLDNIRLAASFAGNYRHARDHALQLFEQLQLDAGLLQRRADSLSVGQQQRVAIARALINQPQIIIADEPSSALDEQSRDQFMRLLLDTVKQNDSTLVFVSHDKSLAGYFDRHDDLQQLNQCGGAKTC